MVRSAPSWPKATVEPSAERESAEVEETRVSARGEAGAGIEDVQVEAADDRDARAISGHVRAF